MLGKKERGEVKKSTALKKGGGDCTPKKGETKKKREGPEEKGKKRLGQGITKDMRKEESRPRSKKEKKGTWERFQDSGRWLSEN